MSIRRKNRRKQKRKPAPSRKSRMKSHYRRKKRRAYTAANKRRKGLLLDEIPRRRHNLFPHLGVRPRQWFAGDNGDWNFCERMRAVMRSDDDYDLRYRPGNTAHFQPSLFNLRIRHSTTSRGEVTYRFLLVRFFEMCDIDFTTTATNRTCNVDGEALTVSKILARTANSTEWRMSPYLLGADRGDTIPKWRVIYDQTFTFNNNGDRTSTKILRIPIQGGRVRYHETSDLGKHAKGHLLLLGLTTAATNSDTRDYDFDYVSEFTATTS